MSADDKTQAVQSRATDSLVSRPQVREEPGEDSLVGLAQTIRESGVLQPLLVRRDGSELVVVEGHRRLRAATLAGLTHIPVIIDDRELSEGEVIYRQLVTNCQRADLTPLEKARAIGRLMRDAGWSASETATKLGMSPATVSKLHSILSLPEDIQSRIGSPGLGLTAAYQIALAGNAEAQQRMANELASGTMTRDGAAEQRRARRKSRASKKKRSRVAMNRVNIPLGGERTVTVAGPGLTLAALIEWLAGLVERLRGAQGQNVELPEAVKLASES